MTSSSQDPSKEATEPPAAQKEAPFQGQETGDAGASSAGSPGDEADQLALECSELKDRLLRMAAESENMRKRFEREKGELAKFATESLLRDLVPVMDSFEQAVPSEESQGSAPAATEGSYREGILMVKKQLLGILKKHGLETVESIGQPFNPNVHQAIQRLEDKSIDADTVHQEFAKGFTLNGRLLRAAMVSVKVPTAP